METGRGEQQSAESESYAFAEETWTPTTRPTRIRSPSQSSLAYSESFYQPGSRPRRVSPLTLRPLPEPHLLRLRPTSLRTQDISYLLTGVFQNLYTAEVIGEEVSASLIKARGSEDARHEEFVDQLQQIRELYKQRLDEVEMLERHIIQARARALAEKERAMHQAEVQVLEPFIKMPPVKTIFRWCVDNELLQKHHLICPNDYYSDTVPFCSAPKGAFVPGYSKLTFSCEKRSVPKKELTKKLACRKMPSQSEEETDYTMDSLTWDSSFKGKLRSRATAEKTGSPKNKNWMNHLRVPQRQLERLLLARMESRNRFLKNPRFFPPNTPFGGTSLLFPPKKPALIGEFQDGELEESCADTPMFLAKPSIAFFTDYEIGQAYEMVISLQNTTSTSRHLRVLPPSTPYFALGLGMFPGKGGMVAPGMTCQYTVQFFPDCLGDFDDFILVETQSAHTLLIPLQAWRPPPVLTLSPVLDCGYCLIGGMKMTRFICKNVGFSVGKFCIMPKKSWPPPSFRAVATIGFVEQPPFGILPSVFELAPGQAVFMQVLFLPTSLGKAEQTFIIVCDNCQIKELVTTGIGQLVALDLIYVSGEKSQPEPGELTDLTAQHFIRFEPGNLQSTASKLLIIRNATHVELAFRWQIVKPNLRPLIPGETYSLDSIKSHPDRETAFSITPDMGALKPHTDHEFLLSFSPREHRDFHSVLQMVLEEVPEPMSLHLENPKDPSYSVDDVIVLEIEVKGSVEPFQVLLEPYALIIPGENYVGMNVKKDFKMWNNSRSAIRYTWGKISDCHIVEVEPCTGTIEPSEVEDFQLNFTGGVPGPTSQSLLCEIKDSPSPVVLHVEAAFKGPALVIDVSALQFGLLRLGQRATNSIQIRNVSQLPATWSMEESRVCLQERQEGVSPFIIEPSSGQVQPLGECRVSITLEARHCQCLQTVLKLEVVNGTCSHLPVYAEVQEPYVYLQSSQVEVTNLYLGVPTKTPVALINGTLLPTQFHWGKLLGLQASFCTAKVSPRRGTLGPREERQFSLELTAHTQDELMDLALPCNVLGMKEPLVLGISGKPRGLQVAIAISTEDGDSSVASAELWPGHPERLHLDFGSAVPLRTRVNRQLILTNCSPIQTPFTLKFEYFGSPANSLRQKPSLPDMPPALLKMARMRELLAKREQLEFMESMLSHGKGAAFFPHLSQGVLGAHQQLGIDLTACANMWGEYWDSLICTVGDLPPAVIPVHMAVVGCPISSHRTAHYTTDQIQKEPVVRFGTQVSGGDTITRILRLSNSSPCDIRLDWETYAPEAKEDRLLELLVSYGPPFPLRDQAGNGLLCPETPESSSSFWSPSPSDVSKSSREAAQSAEGGSSAGASQEIISVTLQGREGVPSDQLFSISPKQVVVPAGGSSTIRISFTPVVLGPDVLHKVECTGSALGSMSLDDEVERELPGRRRRLQGSAVGPVRLHLHGYVRPAQLSVELDSGSVVFWHQASDLIPEQRCAGVLSELVTTRHLKLTNTTEIPHYFRLLVSRPFSVSQDGESRSHRAPGPSWKQECKEGTAAAGKQLVLYPQENMLVNVSFSLSLELLSYQKLPADQMLSGVDMQQSASGEKKMVFTQNLLLEYSNQTTQVVPLRAVVAVPELQLSTSWVDFGTCFVNQGRIREVYLMNLSGSRSYWAVLTGSPQAVGCWRHDRSTRPPPPSPSRFPSPPGAVSCTSPRWWWKVCSVRNPAPCGSGAEARMMRNMHRPTSSEPLPSTPNTGNKHGPELWSRFTGQRHLLEDL
ncbi:deleted in lung and esophageal cancer protein 1-like isoform X1 [Delphinapterus leucas]|uniref:Deleted in lung and esophageal cancer protein 1-like isoform X1 n=2 Tax=Delphinapterus leucas TaxID=9749 RepID=A0A2Y9LKZ3_DELLE|nr:deleted in lung and esophageal cancer protein 1-like isoform X1 [Delphinapterus leucas]XP_022409417.1 deleted in lung and esophageal cancer protein 1-like isoform X1 [Delphinapterus leucas]XP_022409418.1 deleted in lung and esophageal cancer protein 1-like isoform X1 [Delphinapterus leucas]XP_030619966.1 deleted in lung and esophageal cancer protein 1-like isoform X1 [Delphinapterus leucas]